MKLIQELFSLKKAVRPAEGQTNVDFLASLLAGKTFNYGGVDYKIDRVGWYSDPGLYKNSPNIVISGPHPTGEPHGDEKFLNKIRAFLPRNVRIEYSDHGMQGGFKSKSISSLIDPDSPEYELLKKKLSAKPQFTINVDMWVN